MDVRFVKTRGSPASSEARVEGHAMSKPKTSTVQNGSPHLEALNKLQAICGAPALLPGEDRRAYENLWLGIAEATNAGDFLAYIDVDNLAASMWDEWRRRACTSGTLKAAIPAAIAKLLKTALDDRQAHEIAKDYADGADDYKKEVEARLAEMGYTLDDIRGVAFEIRIQEIESLDRLGAKGEWRRAAIRREMDRRREACAKRDADATGARGGEDAATNEDEWRDAGRPRREGGS